MTLIPAEIDYDLIQGADFSETITFYQEEEGGDLEDFTGCTAFARIRKDYDPASPNILAFSTSVVVGQGLITLGGALGTITMFASYTLTEAVTQDQFTEMLEDGIAFYRGVWDVEVTNGGNRDRYAGGIITMLREATNNG